MPFIGMFILLALFVGYVAACGLCLLLTIIGMVKGKLWLKLVGGIPLFCLTTLGAVGLLLAVKGYRDSGRPEVVFRDTFGFDAPNEATLHSGSYNVIFDSGHAELIFAAPVETFGRITTNGFEVIDRDVFAENNQAELLNRVNASNQVNGELVFYRKSPFRNFSSDEAYLVVNTNTGLAFFSWHGVD